MAFFNASIESEPHHGVGDAQGHKRQQQVPRLLNHIDNAVFLLGKDGRIQAREKKHQQLGAEGADGEYQRVGQELFVFIHGVISGHRYRVSK